MSGLASNSTCPEYSHVRCNIAVFYMMLDALTMGQVGQIIGGKYRIFPTQGRKPNPPYPGIFQMVADHMYQAKPIRAKLSHFLHNAINIFTAVHGRDPLITRTRKFSHVKICVKSIRVKLLIFTGINLGVYPNLNNELGRNVYTGSSYKSLKSV